MTPFFSVIIPTYNRAEILPKAIHSVLAQSFKDFELIIVDDGSTDDTAAVVAGFGTNVLYCLKQNGGVCSARNCGAERSTGKYLVFLDSDDHVTSHWLRDFYELITSERPDVGICRRKRKPGERNLSKGFLAGTFAIERSLFFQVGMFDESLRFGENMELKWRLEKVKAKMCWMDAENIFYEQALGAGSDNASNKVDFFYYVSVKHRSLFERNSVLAQTQYQVAGVSCMKLGRKREGKSLLWKGYFKRPLHLKSLLRSIKYSMK